MKKTMIKFLVALLALTASFGTLGTVYAEEAIETRNVYEPEAETKSSTAYGTGASFKLTATAYHYAGYITTGTYSVTPTCAGTSYLGKKSGGWTKISAKYVKCSATGTFLPNNSGTSFDLTASVSFSQ